MSAAPAIHAGPRYRAQLDYARARLCLEYFVTRAFPLWDRTQPFIWSPMVTVQAAIMQQWFAGGDDWRAASRAAQREQREMTPPETKRPLIIAENRAPKTNKSTVASVSAGPWRLLSQPGARLLFVSFGLAALADGLHQRRKTIIDSETYRRWARVSGFAITRSNEHEVATSAGGSMDKAESRRGAGRTTGTHAGSHIYDDPYSKPDMASPTMRERIRSNLTGTFGNRFIDSGAPNIWLTAQRLGLQDGTDALLGAHPAGRITRLIMPRAHEPWRYDLDPGHPWYIPEVLDLGEPVEAIARAMAGEVAWQAYGEKLKRSGFYMAGGHLHWRDWRTREGQLLTSDWAPTDTEAAKLAGTWDAEQQQRVVDDEGAIIRREWLTSPQPWSALPPGLPDEIVISGDTQRVETGKKRPDATALLVTARYSGTLYLVEEVFCQAGLTELAPILWHLWQRHGRPARVVLEDAGAAPAVRSMLVQHGVPVVLVPAKGTGGSVRRLEDVSPLIQAGFVLLPAPDAKRPPWLAAGEPWPGAVLRLDAPSLPPQLRPADGVRPAGPYTVAAPGGWVDAWLRDVCAVGGAVAGSEDRADALSMMLHDVRPRLGQRGGVSSGLASVLARPPVHPQRPGRFTLR